MKRVVYLSVPMFIMLVTACAGPTGPRGPKGERGDDGIQIYSDVIKINAQDFIRIDEYVSVNKFEWDLLDEATVDEGLVLAYLRFKGETAWNSLPYSIPFENDFVNMRYLFDINSFDLIIEGEIAGNNGINEDLFDGDYLRVIAIPPSLMLRAKNLDYSDYDAVVKAYNLEY